MPGVASASSALPLLLVVVFAVVSSGALQDTKARSSFASDVRAAEFDAQGDVYVQQKQTMMRREHQVVSHRHGQRGDGDHVCSDDDCTDSRCCKDPAHRCWRWTPAQSMTCGKSCPEGGSCTDATVTNLQSVCATEGAYCGSSLCCQHPLEKCYKYGPTVVMKCRDWTACDKQGCKDVTATPTDPADVAKEMEAEKANEEADGDEEKKASEDAADAHEKAADAAKEQGKAAEDADAAKEKVKAADDAEKEAAHSADEAKKEKNEADDAEKKAANEEHDAKEKEKAADDAQDKAAESEKEKEKAEEDAEEKRVEEAKEKEGEAEKAEKKEEAADDADKEAKHEAEEAEKKEKKADDADKKAVEDAEKKEKSAKSAEAAEKKEENAGAALLMLEQPDPGNDNTTDKTPDDAEKKEKTADDTKKKKKVADDTADADKAAEGADDAKKEKKEKVGEDADKEAKDPGEDAKEEEKETGAGEDAKKKGDADASNTNTTTGKMTKEEEGDEEKEDEQVKREDDARKEEEDGEEEEKEGKVGAHEDIADEPEHAQPSGYVFGEEDTPECPPGSVAITTEADCEAAGTKLKLSFKGEVDSNKVPKGCSLAWPYTVAGDSGAEFRGHAVLNTHAQGGRGEKNRPLCKVVDATVDIR